MAREKKARSYDFTGSGLGLRVRVMGGLSLAAGVAYLVGFFVLLLNRLGTNGELQFIAAVGVGFLAIGWLLLLMPSRPAMAEGVRFTVVYTLVICVLVLLLGLTEDDWGIFAAFAVVGTALAVGTLLLIREGRTD